jgi:hypothetical protein
MVPIEQFARPRGWFITDWKIDRPGQIPDHTFTVGGSLLIGIVQGMTPACSLVWLDLDGRPCSMINLPFQEGMLYAPDFPVSIAGLSVHCGVNLSIRNGVLEGMLNGIGTDGNTGTFAADANPGG